MDGNRHFGPRVRNTIICPDTIAEKDLAKLSGKEVKVKGTILELKDADPVIEVETLTAK